MGKAVFFAVPAHGGINPLLSTTAELVQRGEHVIFYCSEQFRDKIEKTGAEFRPYRGSYNDFLVGDFDMLNVLSMMLNMTVDKLDNHLAEVRAENPDYVLHDSMCIWGKYISRLLKVPAVSLMHSFPLNEKSNKINLETLPFLLRMASFLLKEKLRRNSVENMLKRKYGIRMDVADLFINRQDVNIVFTSKAMDPALAAAEESFHFVGPSMFFKEGAKGGAGGLGDLPAAQLDSGKTVYVSLGTVHNDNLPFYRLCLEAFAGADYTVVISVGPTVDIGKLADAPPNFLVRRSVPQQQLLQHVDVFVTHSGMNSVNEALCQGVPLILLPHQFEQKMVAERVQALGVGEMLDIRKLTARALREAVDKVLSSPTYLQTVVRLSQTFAAEEQGAHRKAADLILAHVTSQGMK